MATGAGDRFVRRHNTARTSTSNTTAADISYDTAVISDGGYSYSSPEVTVDEAGLYLNIFDLGQVDFASTRAVGTLVPSVNTVDQTRFRATHRYLRNSGGQTGASIGMAILNLSASDDVKVRNPGALTPTDALGSYATNVSYGGGLQLIRLPAENYTHVERTVDAAEVGQTDITTRPWLDSSANWTTITYNSEVRDDDSLYGGSGGDLTLKANTKYMIVWGATIYSADSSRHTNVVRLQINSLNVQTGSGYQRNTSGQGPAICGMYLHQTGGSTETLRMQATHEIEGADAGTPQVSDAYLQVLELPASAEWIHADNSTTDSLTTALAGVTTWYDTPLSSTFRADGDSNLSLDAANDAIQNDSGSTLPILAIGWHRWDRDSSVSGNRKIPWTRWNNGGSAVGYGVAGSFSRGQQSGDDTFQAHHCSVATLDLANGADLSFQVQDEANASNSDMGIYASTSRYFLGVQVLNLNTLSSSVTHYTLDLDSGSFALTGSSSDLVVTRSLASDSSSYTLTGSDASLKVADSEWDRQVRDKELVTSVVRTSNAIVTITLSAVASYDIEAQETVTITIPSSALVSGTEDLEVSTSFTVDELSLTNYNIACNSGSFTLTGTAAALSRGLGLSANSGSYGLTGFSATLTKVGSYDLVADSGAYSLSGTSADVTVSRYLAATPVAYTLTGVALSAIVTRKLEADSGSYSITGYAATLGQTSNYNLSADSGAYSLTGTSADLANTRTLDCNSGTYSLTGYDANFGYANSQWNIEVRDKEVVTAVVRTSSAVVTITLSAATYDISQTETVTVTIPSAALLTGTEDLLVAPTFSIDDVVITHYSLNLESGSYALTGSAVDLTLDLKLIADSGAYSATGYSADFTIDRAIDAEAGSYSLTGSNATLTKVGSYELSADSGSFNLTGSAATLTKVSHYSLAADSGLFSLTGSAATLTKVGSYNLIADSGGYFLTGFDVSFGTVNSQWDAALESEVVAAVVRTSDTVVTITLSALTYDIDSQETVTATIPSSALVTTTIDPVASPSFTVDIAAIITNYTLACDSGAYSVTGSDLDVIATRAIDADSGSYGVTGYEATLTKISSYELSADAGSYSLLGTDTDLARGYPLAANSGAYVLTGNIVDLATTRQFSADPGSYSLTGYDSVLNYSGYVNYGTGLAGIGLAGTGIAGSNVTSIGIAAKASSGRGVAGNSSTGTGISSSQPISRRLTGTGRL